MTARAGWPNDRLDPSQQNQHSRETGQGPAGAGGYETPFRRVRPGRSDESGSQQEHEDGQEDFH